MDYIINHKRFKKKFTENELNKYLYKKNRVIQFPQFSQNYYNFFNSYAKKNYKLINNECKLSVGYVPQDIFLLNATISENIAFGVPPNEIDHNSVMSAARLANIYDFITVDLPEKFNTQVGERGVRLSGGQRQRIGIARALYSNPSILILDEATSALDLITERQIMKSINQLAVDKTIVIVAHRLSTIQSANKVILLKNGSVEATGLFEEVMARNLDLSSFAS